jgi:hypothetical protein
VETRGNSAQASITLRREMRMAGMLLDVMDIGGHRVVFVDMPDAVETHLVVAARADHAIAVNHPVQALMKGDSALRAADANFVMLYLMSVRVSHGRRPFRRHDAPKELPISCRSGSR